MPMRPALRLLGIVVLVLLIVLLGLPLGMAMGSCPGCDAPADHCMVGACSALLTMLLVLALALGTRILVRRPATFRLIPIPGLERPPRSS